MIGGQITIARQKRRIAELEALVEQHKAAEEMQINLRQKLDEELDRHKRMFAATCETLGEIQKALGNEIVGIEPQMVKALVEERDALAAHIDDVHRSINDLIGESEGVAGLHKNGDIASWGDLLEGGHFEGWLLALGDKPDTASLARRDKIKQAEILERLPKDAWLTLEDAIECVDDFAREIRQQVEGCA